MQNAPMLRSVSSQDMSMVRPAPDEANYPHQGEQECRTNHQFIAMLNAYRCSGGLARAQEVLVRFKRCCVSDIATLDRWIGKRKVISFEWQSKMWLPLFQFNRFDMTPQPALGQVLAELTSVYDHWELANWFAQPNQWLAERTPVDMLASDLPAVLHAARADRFIAAG